MASDILQKEIAGLPDDVGLFVMCESKKRIIGFISDAFVSIAPDFDDAPECMKEYV